MESFFSKFRLTNEKERFETVIANIESGATFRGTNLWILIFAIFVASLGLNVNSTAVIIGAMLISPLMGPIMGMGMGLAINDLELFKKAGYNFAVATIVALATSTLFFLISPINNAHSEILARISPNIYDVLIALFGGLAGTLATSSLHKGNVIPGVAIATALMPPLCTAGYGLATLQFSYFFGAFYLFVINAVFIGLATLIMTRFLKFPVKGFDAYKGGRRTRYAIGLIVIVTLLPSIYFGYEMIRNAEFNKRAEVFIEKEAVFPNDFLLKKNIDPAKKKITLVFGGREISKEEIDGFRSKLLAYGLNDTEVEVNQGFAYLGDEEKLGEKKQMISLALDDQTRKIDSLRKRLDEVNDQQLNAKQIFLELKTQYPKLRNAVIHPVEIMGDSTDAKAMMVVLYMPGKISAGDLEKMGNWLKVRMNTQQVRLVLQP
jgi:uncharacterized hydrophobic protein (TIGR00271 family)